VTVADVLAFGGKLGDPYQSGVVRARLFGIEQGE
jgi:hypothetical protein